MRWTYYLMFLIICKLLFTVSPGSIVMTKYVKSTSNLCGCSLWVLVVDARCGCSLWVLVVSARCGCSFWMVFVSARCGSSFSFIRSLAPGTCAIGQTLCPNNNNSNNSWSENLTDHHKNIDSSLSSCQLFIRQISISHNK